MIEYPNIFFEFNMNEQSHKKAPVVIFAMEMM